LAHVDKCVGVILEGLEVFAKAVNLSLDSQAHFNSDLQRSNHLEALHISCWAAVTNNAGDSVYDIEK
jgi:hypothetical protein